MLEYYFFLNSPGRVSLAPFEISVPGAESPAEGNPETGNPAAPEPPESPGNPGNGERIRFRSPAIQFLVRAPGETGGRGSSVQNPRLSWRDVPSRLYPGEAAEFALVRQGWDPRIPFPSPRLLLPRTPIGAILEASPPRDGDEAAGVLLRLRIIPLEEGRLNIPAFSVPAGDYNLNVPALSVPVGPGAKPDQGAAASGDASPVPVSSAPSPAELPAAPGEGLPFPATAPKPLLPFKAGCESIRNRAKSFWDRGLRVEALAELRRNERDYAGGPALIPLRRDAENILGLSRNGDEIWRPRLLFLGIFVISTALAAVSLFFGLFPPKKQVTPGPAWCYRVIEGFKKPAWVLRGFAVFFAVPAFFSLRVLGASPLGGLPFPGLAGLPRPALTREAETFRVPGREGTPVFRFQEGRRVLVRFIRNDWAYAEIPGKEEGGGWVRMEALVFY
jgi:hypothetical protein